MKKAMDDFMRRHRNDDSPDMKDRFTRAIEHVHAVFGDKSFRRWVPGSNEWGSQIVASVYDCQMFSFGQLSGEEIEKYADQFRDGFVNLFSDEEFRKQIDAATNTPSFFKKRVQLTREMIAAILR